MKIALVAKSGLAVARKTNEEVVSTNGVDSTVACLTLVKEILETIPTSDELLPEVVELYIGCNHIKGLAGDAGLKYIRGGETRLGKKPSDEVVALYNEVYDMLALRIKNVVVKDAGSQYYKGNKEIAALVDAAWTVAKEMAPAKAAGRLAAAQAPAVQDSSAVTKAMSEKISEAAMAADLATVQALSAMMPQIPATMPEAITFLSTKIGEFAGQANLAMVQLISGIMTQAQTGATAAPQASVTVQPQATTTTAVNSEVTPQVEDAQEDAISKLFDAEEAKEAASQNYQAMCAE